ncbi:MAG: flippase [Terriglobia bacterium]|jgi:O-antigen/teichoic acid export membrane protein
MRDAATSIGELLLGKEESVTLRNRLVAGTGGLLGLRIAFSGLSFVATVLLARLLGREGLGAYSYAFAWVVLLGVPAILGMDQLLVREMAAYHVKSEWGLMRGLLRRANWSSLLASLGMALLAAAASWALRRHWTSQMVSTFWVALIFLPLITLTRVRQAVMQGLHRVALGAMPEQLIQPALLLGLLSMAYLFWHNRLTAPLAMGLNVVAAAVAFLVGALLLHRTLPRPVEEAEPVYRDSTWARSALPLVFMASMGVLFGQADTLILGAIKGAQAVGVYSVAHKGAELVTFALVVQNAAFASTVASLYAAGDFERLQRLVTRLARWTLLACLPLAIGMIGFGYWFLLYCYGPQFTQARTALAILSFGQLVSVGMGSVGVLLVMTGHERDCATGIAAGAVANILLNLLLVPRWGTEGAAVAYAGSMILWNVLMAVLLYRKVGLHSTPLGTLTFRRSS